MGKWRRIGDFFGELVGRGAKVAALTSEQMIAVRRAALPKISEAYQARHAAAEAHGIAHGTHVQTRGPRLVDSHDDIMAKIAEADRLEAIARKADAAVPPALWADFYAQAAHASAESVLEGSARLERNVSRATFFNDSQALINGTHPIPDIKDGKVVTKERWTIADDMSVLGERVKVLMANYSDVPKDLQKTRQILSEAVERTTTIAVKKGATEIEKAAAQAANKAFSLVNKYDNLIAKAQREANLLIAYTSDATEFAKIGPARERLIATLKEAEAAANELSTSLDDFILTAEAGLTTESIKTGRALIVGAGIGKATQGDQGPREPYPYVETGLQQLGKAGDAVDQVAAGFANAQGTFYSHVAQSVGLNVDLTHAGDQGLANQNAAIQAGIQIVAKPVLSTEGGKEVAGSLRDGVYSVDSAIDKTVENLNLAADALNGNDSPSTTKSALEKAKRARNEAAWKAASNPDVSQDPGWTQKPTVHHGI